MRIPAERGAADVAQRVRLLDDGHQGALGPLVPARVEPEAPGDEHGADNCGAALMSEKATLIACASVLNDHSGL